MNFHRYTGWLLICAASLAWGFEPKASPFVRPAKSEQPMTETESSVASSVVSHKQTQPTLSIPAEKLPAFGTRALRGILINGENSWANVEGDMVRKGGLLDGWRLDRVESDSAHFSRRGKKQVLELQRPQAAISTANPQADKPTDVPAASPVLGGASAGNAATSSVLPATVPANAGMTPQELLQKLLK